MGFPKALLRYRDETFLDTLIGLFAARCQPVIVVLGAHSDRIRERTRGAFGPAEQSGRQGDALGIFGKELAYVFAGESVAVGTAEPLRAVQDELQESFGARANRAKAALVHLAHR